MKIAITGATGSIGTALLRRLLADGEHELVALARRTPVKGRDTQEHGWERVYWTSVDLTRDADRPALGRALADADARDSAAGSTPALRPRSVPGQLRDRIRRGPIASRPRP